MPLGVEVSLGPGNFVSDGEQVPPPKKKREQPPLFDHVYCGQAVAHLNLTYCPALVRYLTCI